MPGQANNNAPQNNVVGARDGQPGAGNSAGGAENDREAPLPENATPAQTKEYITRLQLDRNNFKRQLGDVTRERDQLVASQKNKRRRHRYVAEPTPDDPKYEKAGKRCALMHQLWIRPDIFETEPDATYTADQRYNRDEPSKQDQGDFLDVLDSCPLPRENLLKTVHFQSVLMNAANEQRRNSASRARMGCGSTIFKCTQDNLKDRATRTHNDRFKELLGYWEPTNRNKKSYPTLPPLLYEDEVPGDNEFLFRNPALRRLFRACAFGPSSLLGGHEPADPQGKHVLARILGLKSITPGAIAFSAVLARWCLSPDDEFSETGKTTGIKYKDDYDQYKKLIIEGLRAEQVQLARTATQGPFMRLINEWNKELFPRRQATAQQDEEQSSDDSDVEKAMEQIQRSGQTNA